MVNDTEAAARRPRGVNPRMRHEALVADPSARWSGGMAGWAWRCRAPRTAHDPVDRPPSPPRPGPPPPILPGRLRTRTGRGRPALRAPANGCRRSPCRDPAARYQADRQEATQDGYPHAVDRGLASAAASRILRPVRWSNPEPPAPRLQLAGVVVPGRLRRARRHSSIHPRLVGTTPGLATVELWRR
jgi:hypothetical protein